MLNSCSESVHENRDFDLYLLEGKWEDLSKQNTHLEEWRVLNSDHARGKGFVISGSDTVYIEMLEILRMDDTLRYVARVSNQNYNEPVIFNELENSPERLVFENPDHSFPQRIGYRLKEQGRIEAFIEGKEDGRRRESRFNFARIDG